MPAAVSASASAGMRASAAIRPVEPSWRSNSSQAATTSAVSAIGAHGEEAGVLADRGDRGQARRDVRQQPGGVRDDLARHAETGRQLLDHAVRLAEVGQRLVPTPGRPRAWCPAPGRRGPSPSRWCSGGRPPGTAWGTGPAPRPAPHARASACAGPGRSPRRSAPRPPPTTSPTSRSRAGFAHRIVFCSSSVRIPSACSARNSASDSSRSTSFAGSTGGQTALTAAFTAALRATASCTRSSGASPDRSICTSTACAMRCGRASRAAP